MSRESIKQSCIFPEFTDERRENCSLRVQCLTDHAWTKLTEKYKINHPWLNKGQWLCSRHFAQATVTVPRSEARAQARIRPATVLKKQKRKSPDFDNDTDHPSGMITNSIPNSPRKIASTRQRKSFSNSSTTINSASTASSTSTIQLHSPLVTVFQNALRVKVSSYPTRLQKLSEALQEKEKALEQERKEKQLLLEQNAQLKKDLECETDCESIEKLFKRYKRIRLISA